MPAVHGNARLTDLHVAVVAMKEEVMEALTQEFLEKTE